MFIYDSISKHWGKKWLLLTLRMIQASLTFRLWNAELFSASTNGKIFFAPMQKTSHGKILPPLLVEEVKGKKMQFTGFTKDILVRENLEKLLLLLLWEEFLQTLF